MSENEEDLGYVQEPEISKFRILQQAEGDRCVKCRFWDEDEKPTWFSKPDLIDHNGSCCRYPPVFVGDYYGDGDLPPWAFPSTPWHWWCGEFQAKPE